MDFGDENKNTTSKGPFYGAASFIFVILVLFASVGLKRKRHPLPLGDCHMPSGYWIDCDPSLPSSFPAKIY